MRPVILALSILLLAAPAQAADREAAKASYRQGNEFFDQDRFADAAAAYGHAIEQDPQFLEAYYNRALADEMVDRQKAIADWHQFADLAASSPDFKYQVGQANARIQILGMLPAYPDALQTLALRSGRIGLLRRRSRKARNPRNGTRFPSRFRLAMCPPPIGRKEHVRRSVFGRKCFLWNSPRNPRKRIFASTGRRAPTSRAPRERKWIGCNFAAWETN